MAFPNDICMPYHFELEHLMDLGIPGAREIHDSPLVFINNASKSPVYPTIIKDYWNTAVFNPGRGLSGNCYGFEVALTSYHVQHLLNAPNEGSRYSETWWSLYKHEDICDTVFIGNAPPKFHKIQTRYLNHAARVIHMFITRVCCPRRTYLYEVLDHDVFIIYHTLKGMPVNPTHIVVEHLSKVAISSCEASPYGYLHTIFLNHLSEHAVLDFETRQMSESFCIGADFLRDNLMNICEDSEDDYEDTKT